MAARLAQANLVTQADFNNKLSDLYRKIFSNKTKDLVIKNGLKKLKTFDSRYFFEDDGIQNYFIFQAIHKYFKTVSADNDTILLWRSKGFSNQSNKATTTPNKLLNSSLDYVGSRLKVNFTGDSLKQERLDFRYWKIVNIYIVNEINKSVRISSYPTLENYLFGAVKLLKHVNIDQYEYSWYGTEFDRKGIFQLLIK